MTTTLHTLSWFETDPGENQALAEFEESLKEEEAEMYEQLAEEDFSHWMRSKGVALNYSENPF
jgi:hypothetical protein